MRRYTTSEIVSQIWQRRETFSESTMWFKEDEVRPVIAVLVTALNKIATVDDGKAKMIAHKALQRLKLDG